MNPKLRKILVYIAGPYSGLSDGAILDNILRAEATAHTLLSIGFSVFCPHKNTGWFTQKCCRYGVLPETTCMENGITILERCDALLLLEGWQESVGAKTERKFAEENNIPVFESVAELVEFAGIIREAQ